MSNPVPDLLTTVDVARILGVSLMRVRRLALSRGLTRRGRDWVFTAADVERLRPGPTGRPPKAETESR